MAQPIYKTISAAGTYVFNLDDWINPFNVEIEFEVGAGATASATLSTTLDPINPTIGFGYGVSVPPNPTWTALASPTQPMTATTRINLTTPVRALQLVVGSLSGGDVVFKIIQPMSIN
ncbi:MAG TPA: hypothetical protein PKX13_11990 [Acidiphilium sp.]|nr:MAG: hypothetical protein B7Z68_00735 [Acidobacteria bacterium 21-70-11]HQU24989.1 hypothetical protein [Acidiphilium sp.]